MQVNIHKTEHTQRPWAYRSKVSALQVIVFSDIRDRVAEADPGFGLIDLQHR
jgi:hypothetical protein